MSSSKLSLPVAFVATLLGAVAGGGVAWGTTTARIGALEQKTARLDEDHERLIRIETIVERLDRRSSEGSP